jgi:TRAP-type C4-dicarboxylate transport system permease small subunit
VPEARPAARAARLPRWLAAVLKLLLALLLAVAIVDMLAGVLLRYVVVRLTDLLDLAPVSFFWVEEVGELALAWLTLLGAAVAVIERTHFALALVTHRLSPRAQVIVERVNHLLIAGFGGLVAVYGWKLARLNATLLTPALQISLSWLYLGAVAGGVLMALFGMATALGLMRPRDIEPGGAG